MYQIYFQNCSDHDTTLRRDSATVFLNKSVGMSLESAETIEQHYTVQDIADRLRLSTDKVRELFEDDPAVVKIGERNSGRKRRYVTLRIPHSAVERALRRLSAGSNGR